MYSLPPVAWMDFLSFGLSFAPCACGGGALVSRSKPIQKRIWRMLFRRLPQRLVFPTNTMTNERSGT